MKQHVRRMAILLFAVLAMGSMSVPVFANAQDAAEADSSQTAAAQATETEHSDSPSEKTASSDPAEGNAGSDVSEGKKDSAASQDTPLPKGNLSLVEEVFDQNGASKQFVTLVSRNGNFFYLIIDRNERGENNVYFLNQVDERDLLSLMDEKEEAGLKEELADQNDTARQAEMLPDDPKEESDETKPVKKAGALILLPVLLAALGGGAAFFFLRGKKSKHAQAMRPDPDADYEGEDDADDDYDVPAFFEDDDFGNTEGDHADSSSYGEDVSSD